MSYLATLAMDQMLKFECDKPIVPPLQILRLAIPCIFRPEYLP
jgi:hypothetical protein